MGLNFGLLVSRDLVAEYHLDPTQERFLSKEEHHFVPALFSMRQNGENFK